MCIMNIWLARGASSEAETLPFELEPDDAGVRKHNMDILLFIVE